MFGFGRIAYGLRDNRAYYQLYPNGTHFDAIRASGRFELRAVVDPSADARQLAQQAGVPLVSRDVADLQERDCYDVAVFADPPTGRLNTLAALPSLRAILFEKPLAITSEETAALQSEIARRGIIAQVGFMRRSDDRYRELAAGGLKDRIGHAVGGSARYGNGLLNNGSHQINILEFLLGPVESVTAIGDKWKSDDLALAGDYNLSFVAEFRSGAKVFINAVDFSRTREMALEIWGEKGTLRIVRELTEFYLRPAAPHVLLPSLSGLGEENVIFGSQSNSFENMYQSLSSALEKGTPPDCSLADAAATDAIIQAATKSAELGGSKVFLRQ
jgi:predicted dehydrogenase